MVRKFQRPGIAIFTLAILLPVVAMARMFQIIPPDELIANSTLVFVGKVQSVKTSSIVTSLSYPTWEGVSFPWLNVDVEVTGSIKGVKKDEVVHVMMLSISNPENHSMINSPEVLEPEKGDVFLFCLNRTSITNSFAALTAPSNEFLSIIPLHRAHQTAPGHRSRDSGAQLLLNKESFKWFRNLTNDVGEIVPDAVEKLKETYKTEIEKTPINQIVYLKWQSQTNASGWVRDIPKASSETNSVPK